MMTMRNARYGRTTLWILLSLLLCGGVARAEDEIDPPDRVARLSFINGNVSLAPADSDDWADALLNRPITTGDRIWVDEGSRAEVQLGTSTVHLDEYTGLAFVTLDDDTLRMRLTDGAIAVRVHSLERNETVLIETPNTTVTLREPGEYAVDTEGDADRTAVKTYSGEAEVSGPDESQHGYIVGANEQGIFTGTDDLSSVMTGRPPHVVRNVGVRARSGAPSIRLPRTTCRPVRSAIRISILTAPGATTPSTATSGSRACRTYSPTGRRTDTAAGSG